MPRWIQRRTHPFDLIPIEEFVDDGTAGAGIRVVGDLPDFVSPVTGEVIHGRAGMRNHMRQHQLAHADDFKETWKTAAKEREKFQRGEHQGHKRDIRNDLVDTMKKLGG